jgi:hypothetical protein
LTAEIAENSHEARREEFGIANRQFPICVASGQIGNRNLAIESPNSRICASQAKSLTINVNPLLKIKL